MKQKLSASGLIPRSAGFLFTLCFSICAFAQNQKAQDTSEEKITRQKMKEEGLPFPVIDKLIQQNKELEAVGRKVNWISMKQNPSANSSCSGMGVENGWGVWQWQMGTNSGGNPPVFTNPPALNPAAPNFSITSGPGIDPNTPGSPSSPSIPYVCPGFGNHSIQIGATCAGDGVVERLTYPLTVTVQDTNFTYAYALVIEDAGHLPNEQPFAGICIYDTTGNPVPCGCFTYTPGTSLPGLYSVNGNGCAPSSIGEYKPWTTVGVNLAAYIGQTVTVVIINADCIYGSHFAYSYWDFLCSSSVPFQPQFCSGQQITLCAPTDPNISYAYQWYLNGSAIPPPAGTQTCITPSPTQGDTFWVHVMQPSVCNFYLLFTPTDTCLSAANEISENEITVFPNPSSGSLFIDFGNKNSGKAEISFSDVMGRIVYATTVPAIGKQAIDVSHSSGIYFLKLKTAYGIVAKKIVIEK